MKEMKEHEFVPYKGEKPYIFVCASVQQSEEVLETVAILQKNRYRIWYDPECPDDSDGVGEPERRLRGAGTVLLFLSAETIAAPARFKEIKTASVLKKNILVVRTDFTPVPDYWGLALEDAALITVTGTGAASGGKLSAAGRAVLASSRVRFSVTPQDRANAILESHLLTRVYQRKLFEDSHIRPIIAIIAVILFLVGIYLIFAAATGRIMF